MNTEGEKSLWCHMLLLATLISMWVGDRCRIIFIIVVMTSIPLDPSREDTETQRCPYHKKVEAKGIEQCKVCKQPINIVPSQSSNPNLGP
jgi:hypothetical protein